MVQQDTARSNGPDAISLPLSMSLQQQRVVLRDLAEVQRRAQSPQARVAAEAALREAHRAYGLAAAAERQHTAQEQAAVDALTQRDLDRRAADRQRMAREAREYRQRTGQDYALASNGEGGEWPLDNWGNTHLERAANEDLTSPAAAGTLQHSAAFKKED